VKRLWAFGAIYFCWGGTFLAIRYLVAEMPPLFGIALRCTGGALLFFGWLAWRGALERPDAAQWRTALVSGVFLFLGCHGLLARAEQRVPSGEAALLMTSIPLWLVLLDAALRRERPRPRVLLGLAVGVLGVAVLTAGDGAWSGATLDRAALLLSGLCWAVGSLVGRDGARPVSAAQATGMQLGAGALVLVVMSLLSGELRGWSVAEVSPRAFGALGFLILGGTVLGFGAYTWLLRVASPAAVGSYAFVNPVVALLLAHAVGDGQVTGRTLAAGTLVIGAVLFTRDQDSRRTEGVVRSGK
jgi:drug/metabolite transporter (DMT)-like permease